MAVVDGGASVVSPALLELRDDQRQPLPFEPVRWHGAPSPGERHFLAGLAGPVLDVGCGPGRVLDVLARRRVVALGVDPSPTAVGIARSKGCAVLQRSVFDTLPGTGRWQTVLLLDGNIGIGGDPDRLLRRCATLVSPDGTVAVEVEPAGTGWRACLARLERGGEASEWFPWAVVGCDAVGHLATSASLAVHHVRDVEGRTIVELRHAAAGSRACA
jgi:SAM-dependent methyltransferase